MSNTPPCPTAEQIDDLLANRLPAAEADALRRHLTTCPACLGERSNGAPCGAKTPTYPFLSPPRTEGELGWLDGHRILGLLGEGGISIVFDAEDTQLGRRVALKVLRPRMSDPVTRERFLREARLIAGLPHEHIVTVFRVGEENGVPYLTMERLEGASLEDRLRRDRWLPLAEALALTREAAEGLIVAHEAGLVHRDIKPANLWLETRGSRFRRVKLIDFGIARMVNQDAGLTATGQVLGTPMYMSPEQASGSPVDGRTDLYSLGSVLFHMLTGRPPFDGREPNTMALLHAIITGEAPKVSEVAPALPGAVAELIQQLLARDPDSRPENARVLAERLRRLEETVGAEVVPPPPPTAAPAARRLVRRPGVLGIWLGILAIVAAMLVSAAALWSKLSHHPAGKIKLGLLHSFTDGMAVHERPVAQATRFAVEEINEKGGVAGRLIEVVQEDGRSSEDTFAEKARLLIEEQGVEVVFGCWSSSARKRVEEVCRRHDRLLFYPAMSEGLETSPNVVYLGGVPNQTVVPLVEWASRRKNKTRFYLIGTDSVFSHAVNEILKDRIADLGGKVVGTHYARAREADFAKAIGEIAGGKVHMVINTLDGHSNHAFCTGMRAAGLTQDKVSTAWVTLSEAEFSTFNAKEIAGDYSVGCYFERLPTRSNAEFVERFRKKYGPGERVNDSMETAYFGVYLWKKAVEKAVEKGGTADLATLREALRGLGVDAPEGEVHLDRDNQHAYRRALVGEIVESRIGLDFKIIDSSLEPLHPDPFPPGRSEEAWGEFLAKLNKRWGGRWANPR
ncbi:MAG: transporter substrate-binding protein [Gemmataceae bacterium]